MNKKLALLAIVGALGLFACLGLVSPAFAFTPVNPTLTIDLTILEDLLPIIIELMVIMIVIELVLSIPYMIKRKK